MSAVNLKDVSFSYCVDGKRVKVLDGISLNIAAGEMLAIKGPSGSGKSTLLYVLAGLLKPDSGSVSINGQDICNIGNLELARIRNRNF
ncbi:MAG: ATP-binding cassette domain-containing protein, partial [Oligoflexia bacterium]|nr:ATP-binding cassette domain-containing protein [Oligoflexia bacterium]